MSYAKTLSVFLICICSLALTQPVWGQAAMQNGRAVPGHFDPLNGHVKPMPTEVVDNVDAALASFATFGGTFVFKFTITVKSTNLGSDSITCEAGADVDDQNQTTFVSAGLFEEGASVAATKGTGTASCTVTIPYSWSLEFASTDMVNLSYVITASTSTGAGLPQRFNTHTLPSIKVPANGLTTTINVSATI